VEVRTEIEHLIAEARQAIEVSKALSIASIGWMAHFASRERVSGPAGFGGEVSEHQSRARQPQQIRAL